MGKTTIAKSFSLLTALTLFEKVFAFVFQAILASLLGASAMTDAYFSASEFFGVLEVTAISTLSVVALNRFSHCVNQEGEEEAFSFLSNLLSFYIPIVTVLSVGIFAFATPISYVVAPGFSLEARDILVKCIRVMAVIPIIECVTAIAIAVLRQKRRFAITGLKSFFISAVGIVFIFIFYKMNVNVAVMLSAAYVISMLLFCIVTVIGVRKYGKIRLVKPQMNGEIKGTFRMVLPLIVSHGITRTTLMIAKIIASFLGDGAVSQLTYAHNLYAVVSAVFVTNLTVILLTDFNELLATNALQKVNEKIKSVASVMTVLLIPISIVSVVCSQDVVKLIYGRGQFAAESVELVAGVLAVYALGFVPTMLHGIYNQVLYAKGDTVTPMWIALINIAINVIVSALLMKQIGLMAVAVASVASSAIAAFLCSLKLKRFLPDYQGCYSFRFVLLCLIAGAFCLLSALFVRHFALSALLSFIITTAVSFFAFVVVLVLLKEQHVLAILKMMKERLMKRKAK